MTREEFMTRVTVVNFKESRGHDAPSLEWDIKFDNVKVCNCWDDSYGGELQVTDYKNHRIDNIYSTIDKDSLWDEKYKWTTPLDILLEECLNNHLEKKDYDKGLMINDIVGKGYSLLSWGSKKIPTIIKKYDNGFDMIQNLLTKNVLEGREIINLQHLKDTYGFVENHTR